MSDKYFSQSDEEKYIVEYFNGKTGRFLDIGAYDGKAFSNTYKLGLLGWSGVLVEPAPKVFHSLINNLSENKKMTLVNTAITLENSSNTRNAQPTTSMSPQPKRRPSINVYLL